MSALEELHEWLARPDRTFNENLNFAINVCKTIEFAHQGKYEVVFDWFLKEFPKCPPSSQDLKLLSSFIALEFPQHLVHSSKTQGVIDCVRAYVTNAEGTVTPEETINLLFTLTSNQSYQMNLNNPESYFELFRTVFSEYIRYFKAKEFCPSDEVKFFGKALDKVKNFILRRQDLEDVFGEKLLETIIVASLFMYSEKIIYNDIISILRGVFFKQGVEKFLECSTKFSLPAALYCLDFAINHFQTERMSIWKIVQILTEVKLECEAKLYLFAHALDLLRKYNVDVEAEFNSKTSLQMISEYVESCISQHSTENLKLVLILICSTVRLNPLSLNKVMFRITAEYMLVPKSTDEWDQFVEFLVLMIDVFKKIGRSEKLISYLIKSLKGHLEMNGLHKSLKRKSVNNDHEVSSKLPKKSPNGKVEGVSLLNYDDTTERFLDIIRGEFKPKQLSAATKALKWKHIAMAWPAESVGKHFSEFVASLTSKPSLVLWKTLIFAVDENIKAFRAVAPAAPSETTIVLMEFNSALLSQYLMGSRLPEHSDKFGKEITATREIMQKILQDFGETLLECEHNNRTMEAYLEVCLAVGNFDLLMSYYCSEVLSTSLGLHSYLSKDQWISLEQRIVNFGNSSVKYSIKELNLQKLKAKWLFSKEQKSITKDITRFLLGDTLNSSKVLRSIFEDSTNLFLLQHLQESEKREILQMLLPENTRLQLKPIKHLTEDQSFTDLAALRGYDFMASCFGSKKSIMANVSTNTTIEELKTLLIQSKPSKQCSMNYCDTENLEQVMIAVLDDLPIGCCSLAVKKKLLLLSLVLYRDILATKCDKLIQLGLDLLSKLLHFGRSVEVFSILDLNMCMQIFPPVKFEKLYQLIFSDAKIWNNNTESNLSTFLATIENHKFELDRNELALISLVLQFFHKCPLTKIKEIMGKLIDTVIEYIHNFFDNISGNDEEQEKQFIESTAIVMHLYLNHQLVKSKHVEMFEEWIQKIYRKYIFHSRGNESYMKLIGAAIPFGKQLGFGEDEVDLIIEEMWKNVLNAMKSADHDVSSIEKMLRLVTSHQTPQQLINMIRRVDEELTSQQALQILLYLSRCQLSAHMAAVLSSCCQILLFNKLQYLQTSPNWSIENADLVLIMLELLKGLCYSKKHPITIKFVDDMLMFLMDIRISHFKVEDDSLAREQFHEIYKGVVSVCSELIHCQSSHILNRVPQFGYIFKNLLNALVSYRGERLKFSDLETADIEKLAALGHDLENLVHSMTKYSQEMRRVAPYLLSFAINKSISENNSTVRYPKIKVHVENICYELHSMCDHRVGGFILRVSNDAARQFYENLCKDYDKYRKFKGKV